MNAVIWFDPSGFVVEGRQIMGRLSAGAAFLRAAVAGRRGEPIVAYVKSESARSAFLKAVSTLDPDAEAQCIGAGDLARLAELGTLYRADPMIAAEARLRLREGPASYSICGITHTVSSAGVLEGLGQLTAEPVMEWDAIICTSAAARNVVQASMADAWDQLCWLTGASRRPASPQLPVIPLGVHCEDWTPTDAKRAVARDALRLAGDEVALLFAGRLSYAGKAHPFQMFDALQRVAERSGRKLVLLMAGQYFLDHVQKAFEEAAKLVCPDVRLLHVDGADATDYASAFAAADIFLSLADSHQETFGITPVEAMASALPVVVSDWNGYRDTVMDGQTGYRIATWTPAPETGDQLARFYESTGAFEAYSARVSGAISIDLDALVDRLTLLIADADLRRRLGTAGLRRAREIYDWPIVYGQYRELWAELAEIRRIAPGAPDTQALLRAAPGRHHAWPDPYRRFASFPTRHIEPHMIVSRAGSARLDLAQVSALAVFAHLRFSPAIADTLFRCLDRGPAPFERIVRESGLTVDAAAELIGRLAKMNLVTLASPDAAASP